MHNIKNNLKYLIVFLLALLFISLNVNFIISGNFYSFDTLRELSFANHIVEKGSMNKSYEFGLPLLFSVISLTLGINPELSIIVFSHTMLLITSLLFFILANRLSEDKIISGVLSTFLFFHNIIYFNLLNFRPEIFSYMIHYIIFFLIYIGIKNKNNLTLFLTIIPASFLMITHKTGRLIPGVIIILGTIMFFYKFVKIKEFDIRILIKFYLLGFIIILFNFSGYLNFIEFYFDKGPSISPQGFSLPLENWLGFFQILGGLYSIILILSLIILISFFLKRKKEVNDLFYFSFGFVGLMYYSFIVVVPRLGISILPTRFYPYLLLCSLIIAPLFLKHFKRSSRRTYIILLFLIIVSIPISLSDNIRITANLNYLEEVKELKLVEGDVIFATYTSSPVIINQALTNSNYDNSIYVISGYHFWGEYQNTLSNVRNVYLSENEEMLLKNICKSLSEESSYLHSLPEAEDFLVPNNDVKFKISNLLFDPNRILLIYSKFDMAKDFNSNGNNNVGWWRYRTVDDLDYEKLSSFKNLDKIYSSDNLIIFELKGECPNEL